MPNVFVSSDHHFSHAATIFSFKRADGSPMRDFGSVEEMDEYMVDRHNSVVRPQDKWYCLGDVSMKDSGLQFLKRMNGHGRLILGNHDRGKVQLYTPYFEAIYSSRLLDRMIFTHIPIHPDSLGKNHACVHGHSHQKDQWLVGDKYFSVCVETLGYTPISLEDIKSQVQKHTGETW